VETSEGRANLTESAELAFQEFDARIRRGKPPIDCGVTRVARILPRPCWLPRPRKGPQYWLVKDVAALGHTARAASIETVAKKLNRNFTVDDLKTIAAFREEIAGSGGGVDFVKHGASAQDKYQPFMQELKLHGEYTWCVGEVRDQLKAGEIFKNICVYLHLSCLFCLCWTCFSLQFQPRIPSLEGSP